MTRHGSLVALGIACQVACHGRDAEPAATEPPVTEPVAKDLKAQLEAVRVAKHLPALGFAVWRHGKLVALEVTGTRKAGDRTHPVTADDQWHLGSDTKAMTATLIGIYVDRGVLHWDDRIDKLFAGAKNDPTALPSGSAAGQARVLAIDPTALPSGSAAGQARVLAIDPGYAAVTLDQLLQHRSGAPANFDHADEALPRAEIISKILASPPDHASGTFLYSNAGYMIAGVALERATGKTWEQLMRDELFAPLHMTSCGFGAPGNAAKIDEPWGHIDERPIPPDSPQADNAPSLGPAGTVHCSLGDWGKFLAIHAAPSTALVSAATMTHLHTAPVGEGQPYMGGWIVTPVGPHDVRFSHEGSNTMWHAIALVVPALDESIAIVANRFDPSLFGAMAPLIKPYLKR